MTKKLNELLNDLEAKSESVRVVTDESELYGCYSDIVDVLGEVNEEIDRIERALQILGIPMNVLEMVTAGVRANG